MASFQPHQAPASPLLRGSVAQQLRIVSGLILFTFALTHLLNHSLGIWSIGAMDAAQAWRTAVTRWTPVSILLLAAFLTHLALNLVKIARRTTWRMPVWEAIQIGFGLLIPLLLLQHAVSMRAHFDIEGLATRYSDTLPELWNLHAAAQMTLVLIVWTHGCIGIHYWLRLGSAYRRAKPFLLALAVLVPTLALAGFIVAGRDAAALLAERQALQQTTRGAIGYDGAAVPAADPVATTQAAQVEQLTDIAGWTAWMLLAGLALAIAMRLLVNLRHRRIRVSCNAGPAVATRVGPTLLEISRMSGVPHAAICGGRARCSTCRVKVETSARALRRPGAAEAATLTRIRADPDVRLACQLRPRSDLTVTRLVRPPDERRGAVPAGADAAGVEQTLAILFLDIRGFTSLSETRLPYDTVFLLNRFFAEIGAAVTGAGGWIDKYLGDGLMALFGLRQTPEQACRAALVAAMRIDAALDHVNALLGDEIAEPLRIGVGLHVGPLVLGRIGHSASAATTVIGPPVNVASRLESLSKEHGVQLVVSVDLARIAGLGPGSFPEMEVAVRGAADPVHVLLIPRGRDLAAHLGLSDNRTAA